MIYVVLQHELRSFIIKMLNICNLIGWNSVHIYDIFNCYSANINGMWKARKRGGIYKTSIVGTLPPSKNWVIWEGTKNLTRKGGGGNSEKKRGWYRNGGLPVFYYFTVQLHLLCGWGWVKFVLLHFDSSVF